MIGIVIAVVLIGLCALWLGRSRGQGALAKYKAELRARGEKISWTELGFPRPPQTNDSLQQLVAAMDRMPSQLQPGLLLPMDFVGAGRVESCWSGPFPRFSTNASAAVAAMTWEQCGTVFQAAAADLADIRAALENPPRYFINDPSKLFNQPKIPFLQQRNAAQWLSADTIRALHDHRLYEALANLHALTQLVHLHEEDPTLVSQMIRIAIAGLAQADTWEALRAEGWSEQALAALQKDWEGVELLAALESCMEGERAFGEWAFTCMRTASAQERMNLLSPPGSSSGRSASDYFNQWVVTPLWRANSEADELFFLQHQQRCLDSIRQLRCGSAGPLVDAELAAHYVELNKRTRNRLAAIRYWFSALAIPNVQRAAQSAAKAETLRRLTVAAIALQRYKLRHGDWPAELAALVPEFLSIVPLDVMSGKPLGYRRPADGSFMLYSVGEDGRDDGGDASATTATGKFDLWSGRDAVWSVAEKKLR